MKLIVALLLTISTAAFASSDDFQTDTTALAKALHVKQVDIVTFKAKTSSEAMQYIGTVIDKVDETELTSYQAIDLKTAYDVATQVTYEFDLTKHKAMQIKLLLATLQSDGAEFGMSNHGAKIGVSNRLPNLYIIDMKKHYANVIQGDDKERNL